MGQEPGQPATNRLYPYEAWTEDIRQRGRGGGAGGGGLGIARGKDRRDAKMAALLRDRSLLTKARRQAVKAASDLVEQAAEQKDAKLLNTSATLLEKLSEGVEQQIEQAADAGKRSGRFGEATLGVDIRVERPPHVIGAGAIFAPVVKRGAGELAVRRAGAAGERGAGDSQDHGGGPVADRVDVGGEAAGHGILPRSLPQPGEEVGVARGEPVVGEPAGADQTQGQRDGSDGGSGGRQAAGVHRDGQVPGEPGDSPAGGGGGRGLADQAGGVRRGGDSGATEPPGAVSGHHDADGIELVEGAGGGRGGPEGNGDRELEDQGGGRGDGERGRSGEGAGADVAGVVCPGVGGRVHDGLGAGVPAVHQQAVVAGALPDAGAGAAGAAGGRGSDGGDGLGGHGDGGAAVAVGDEARRGDRAD